MDRTRFDDLARALGAGATRRAGIRAALGALIGMGLGAGAASAPVEARRKRCKGGCPPDQVCRRGACVCPDDRPICGDACCGDGQECRDGTCVDSVCPVISLEQPACFWLDCQTFGNACCWTNEGGLPAGTAAQCQALDSCEPNGGGLSGGGCYKWAESDSTAILPPWPACLAKGSACKNAGAPCCAGLACGSGQGGGAPVCLVPAGGACAVTADCVYGAQCLMGLCVANPTCTVPFGGACVAGVDICCEGACGGTIGFNARNNVQERAWKCCVGYGGKPDGETCSNNDGECCSGHCCRQGSSGSRNARALYACSATACL